MFVENIIIAEKIISPGIFKNEKSTKNLTLIFKKEDKSFKDDITSKSNLAGSKHADFNSL